MAVNCRQFYTAVLALLLLGRLDAATVIVPYQSEGSAATTTPGLNTGSTLQFVFASSFFSGITAGSAITGMSFRQNNGGSDTPAADITFANYDIQLSKSLLPAGILDSSFANNIDVDVVTVRSGSLTIPADSYPGGGNPNDFGPEITFTAPYTYTGGDLLVTIRYTGASTTIPQLDSRPAVIGEFQAQFASGYSSTTATSQTSSVPVVQFVYAVPEPGRGLLLVLAALGMLLQRSRRCA